MAHIYDQIPPYGTKQAWIGTPGQNAYLTYHAEAGQKILIKVDNSAHKGIVSTSAKSNVYAPAITTVNYQATGVAVQGVVYAAYTPDGVTVPATGDYSIDIDPESVGTGPVSASLYFVPPDRTFSISIGDRFGLQLQNPPPPPLPGTIAATCPAMCLGQNAWYKFQGTAGQKVSLWRRDNTSASSMGQTDVNLNKPNGQFLVPITQTVDGTFVDAITLPETGEYKIFVDPLGSNVGTADFDLYGIPSNVISTSINGSPVTVNTAVPGHNPSVSFTATEGQQARINVSGATVPNGTYVRLKKSDGSVLAGSTINAGTSLISSTALPATGTYLVEIDPSGTALGAATIAVGGDVYQNLPANGTATATINNPGQSAWFTFSGTAGQRVSLGLSNVTIGSGYASFRNPNGTLLGNASYFNTSGGFVDTVTLPASGQYKVAIDPDSTYTGSATLTLYNVPSDDAGTIAIGGDPITRSTTVPGQNIALTFNGVANQKIDVFLSEVTIPSKSFYIKKPDGSQLTGAASFSGTATYSTNIILPLTRVYTLITDPSGADIGAATMQIGGVVVGGTNRVGLNHAVSVRLGAGTNPELTEISKSISVRFGNLQVFQPASSVSVRYGNMQNFAPGSSVSVTTGPLITGRSLTQITRGATATLTLTGVNFTGATTLRFLNNSNINTAVTVSNLSVNGSGTSLTATITIAASAVIGTNTILVVTPDASSPASSGTNTINIVP